MPIDDSHLLLRRVAAPAATAGIRANHRRRLVIVCLFGSFLAALAPLAGGEKAEPEKNNPADQSASPAAAANMPIDSLRNFSAIQRIKEQKHVYIGLCAADKPPFYFVNSEGKLCGSDIDIAEDIAKILNVEPIYVRTAPTHNDLIDQVARYEVDFAISSISLTLQRAQRVYFTQPYLVVRLCLVFNWRVAAAVAREPDLTALNQPAFHVAVPKGTSHVENIARILPKASIFPMESRHEWGKALLAGEIAAVFRDESEYYTILEWYPEAKSQLSLWTIPGYRDPLAIAVPRGAEDLLQFLNIFLALRERPATLSEIFALYPNSTLPPGSKSTPNNKNQP